MSNEQLDKNKELVAKLMHGLFEGENPPQNIDVIDELVHENYIQHNPLAGQGPEGLRNFVLEVMPKITPKSMIESRQLAVNLIAEGDFVVRQEVRTDWMLIDIFRVKDGLLIEHWDALRSDPGSERIGGF
ncbi:nuclear transport factor 2 family protein [Streptomyces sp. NPDC086519]|uniref:nuclear transport factor 2 family protein n=1 Tax=unclassified Streptomyces TaxID=2593676 RepID=UPI003444E030